ncbi:hypothetical protein [Actinacidiphila acididurans]|uniref:Uncharacterized protein n=1 Tax=Actinacidiphila acididurans TaxID=2784346 RepID=A0ABS2TWA5_9ACTN|nr:hypothetical protein [Actinacidiphila acididurans]MBM9507621.1 hypothetical protein [Actinacidiphila acididurans]
MLKPVQLLLLASILDEAAAAQGPADGAVAACGAPVLDLTPAVRSAGQQSRVYVGLTARLHALELDDEVAPLRDRAAALLAYHELLLREAMTLAVDARADPRVEKVRLKLNGIGAPGDALGRLRREVRALADEAVAAAPVPAGATPSGFGGSRRGKARGGR